MGHFVALSWPDQFEEVMAVATAGLGEPNELERRVMAAAGSLDHEGTSIDSFLAETFDCAHRAAVGRTLDSPEANEYALLLWPGAWNEGSEMLSELQHRHFPDGPPQG